MNGLEKLNVMINQCVINLRRRSILKSRNFLSVTFGADFMERPLHAQRLPLRERLPKPRLKKYLIGKLQPSLFTSADERWVIVAAEKEGG